MSIKSEFGGDIKFKHIKPVDIIRRNNMTKEDWQKLYNDARNDNERNALDMFVSMMMTIRQNIVLRTKSKKDTR